jgi:uncharacterized protein (DUF1697 family)
VSRQTFVALLRGVNVGGRKLPMRDLAELLSGAGHGDVRTYIQSGNVVLTSAEPALHLAPSLEKAIHGHFGLDVAVLLRTNAQLRAVADANPFPNAEGARLHVVFLERAPAKSAVARLDPARSPGDEVEVAGRELYLRLPNGAGRTKLTLDYLERILGVRGTQRNWNTLLKLIDLSAPPAAD